MKFLAARRRARSWHPRVARRVGGRRGRLCRSRERPAGRGRHDGRQRDPGGGGPPALPGGVLLLPRPRRPGNRVRADPHRRRRRRRSTSRCRPGGCRWPHPAPRPREGEYLPGRGDRGHGRLRRQPGPRTGHPHRRADRLHRRRRRRGGELFRINCAQCHQASGQRRRPAPGQVRTEPDGVDRRRSSTRPCSPGRRTCPSSATRSCPPREKQEIIAYIQELQQAPNPGWPQPRPFRSGDREVFLGLAVFAALLAACRLDRNQVAMTDIAPTERPLRRPRPGEAGHSPVADGLDRLRATDTDPQGRRPRRAPDRLDVPAVNARRGAVRRRLLSGSPSRPSSTSRCSARWAPATSPLGLTFGLGVLLIGVGAHPVGAEAHERRRDRRSSATTERLPAGRDRRGVLANYERGIDESGIAPAQAASAARSIGALGLFADPARRSCCADLSAPTPSGRGGPVASRDRSNGPSGRRGIRLVNDVNYAAGQGSELPVGGLVNAEPETLPELARRSKHPQRRRPRRRIIVVRMDPNEHQDPRAAATDWHVDGILAYSKICTHVGCPIALYEQQTHHLLCPCHQSTFDLGNSGTWSSVRPPAAAAAADHRGRGGLPRRHVATSPSPSDRAFWSADERPSSPSRARPGRRARPTYVDKPAIGSNGSCAATCGKVFPDHWSFLLGEIALYSFIVLLLTGVFLTIFFKPSMAEVDLRRLVRAAARRPDVRGLRVDPRHLLRHPRRPAASARSTTGRPCCSSPR